MADRVQQEPLSAAVTQYLQGIDFPADRDAVIRHARRQDVDDELLQRLDRMPNRDYGSLADVIKGLGQQH